MIDHELMRIHLSTAATSGDNSTATTAPTASSLVRQGAAA